MRLAGSASVGRFHGNKKRPPTARQRRIEGLTTRSVSLLMADLNLMDRGVLASAHDRAEASATRRNDG
jgi:hypothetical protein